MTKSIDLCYTNKRLETYLRNQEVRRWQPLIRVK